MSYQRILGVEFVTIRQRSFDSGHAERTDQVSPSCRTQNTSRGRAMADRASPGSSSWSRSCSSSQARPGSGICSLQNPLGLAGILWEEIVYSLYSLSLSRGLSSSFQIMAMKVLAGKEEDLSYLYIENILDLLASFARADLPILPRACDAQGSPRVPVLGQFFRRQKKYPTRLSNRGWILCSRK